MTTGRIGYPPKASGRGEARSDNMVLMPASRLPIKKEWQGVASQLPPGATLFVVPNRDIRIRRSMKRVATLLRSRGKHIATLYLD